jgi:hypothetical protein
MDQSTSLAPPPSEKKTWVALSFVPLIVGTLLAAFLLNYALRGGDVNFEELGLGFNTKSVFAEVDGEPVHCDDFGDDRYDAALCLEAAAERGGDMALWLGNSQLHGLNDQQEGETTAIPILRETLSQRGLDLLTLSQPNATLEEHYLMFEHVRARLPLRLLILPVVMDDLREFGVRRGVAHVLGDPATSAALADTPTGQALVEKYTPEAPTVTDGATDGATDADLDGLDQTVQEVTEEALTGWLRKHWRLWKARPQLRGQLITQLKAARKSAFRVTPSTKRPMMPAHYHPNMSALRATIQSARAHDIDVLLYIPPIRSDVEIPYVAEEYARFKEEIEQLAAETGSGFVNLELLVPGELWGMKASTTLSKEPEYDFMHFKAAGHRLLADALAEEVEAQGWASSGSSRATSL